MIEFLNPFLVGGLAAISAPVIIHLLHRRKIKQVDWAAMRFLLELLAKRRRRLFLDQLLLLLVRTLIVACIALAMLRPAFHRRNGGLPSAGMARQGRTASVLLIDDSLSSGAGRAQPASETMKALGLAYVDSLAPGDEVSVLLMSQLGAPANDPAFDLGAVKSSLSNLKPSAVATDVQRLLEAGLSQLKRHINPGAELVLLTDARKDGWHSDDKVRWDELREQLTPKKGGTSGTRRSPHVVVLAPAGASVDENLAITSIGMDRTLVSAGRPANIRVLVQNFGKQGSRQATVQVSVNGVVIGSRQLEIPPSGQQEPSFPNTFPTPGSYAVEAVLVDNHDSLAPDDRRATSIQVESSLPVLLVDGPTFQGLEGKVGFLHYALEPESEPGGAFKVTRIPLTQFLPSMLKDSRVVVLGDARVLEPAMVDALERYVVGGGGVLVGLGPDSDFELINRYWARSGEGFLPCPVSAATTPDRPAIPASVNFAHPVFSGFGSRTDEAWKAAKVRSYFKLETGKVNAAALDPLLRLDNGDVLVAERRRGLGLVALVGTTLNADWTDLPLQAAYVPLMRGIVGHLGSFIIPPRNLLPGERITYAKVEAAVASKVTGEDSAGKPLKLSVGAWEGRDAVLSDPLLEPGTYVLHDPNEPAPIRCSVAPAASESMLEPIADRDISAVLPSAGIFHSAGEIAKHLDPARRQSVELWKLLLAGAMALLFCESWLARREALADALRSK